MVALVQINAAVKLFTNMNYFSGLYFKALNGILQR